MTAKLKHTYGMAQAKRETNSLKYHTFLSIPQQAILPYGRKWKYGDEKKECKVPVTHINENGRNNDISTAQDEAENEGWSIVLGDGSPRPIVYQHTSQGTHHTPPYCSPCPLHTVVTIPTCQRRGWRRLYSILCGLVRIMHTTEQSNKGSVGFAYNSTVEAIILLPNTRNKFNHLAISYSMS